MTFSNPNHLGLLYYRLIMAGIIILFALNLGSRFYVSQKLGKQVHVKVKILAPYLEKSTLDDLELKIGDEKIILRSKDLRSWLEPYKRDYSGQNDIRLSAQAVNDYMTFLAANVNTNPINAEFEFENDRAKVFIPAAPGRHVSIEKSQTAIMQALFRGQNKVSLMVDIIEPEITLEKINSLGITSLLASGESNFAGSTFSRIKNIKIASSKYNGLILKPGEEFSFNDILGEVDEKGGYAPEKVIKNKKLIYEYGGGICQVSTTLFRAAVLSGLPIIERHAHAFPVQYYNPQGLDATIYPGVSDLKFKNGTSNHILLQTKIVGTKLIFEIYGSRDGREIVLDGPHQYDMRKDGSMKAYFIRTIKYQNGEEKNDKFTSIYRSPSLYPLEKNPFE